MSTSPRRFPPLLVALIGVAVLALVLFGLRAPRAPAPAAVPEAAAAAPAPGAGRTIPHAQGSTVVAPNPKKVVVFDLATLDTLDALGVEVQGVAGEYFPGPLAKYADAKKYPRFGTLFEPDYEALHAARPDLVITGGRSSARYAKLAAMVPTIDQVTDDAHFLVTVEGNTERLAAIFDKQEQARTLLEGLHQSIATLKGTTASRGKGLIVLTSGGRMSAYGPGSRFGVLHDTFGIPPAAPSLKASLHGEAVGSEFILETNPEWLFVIDRDAAIGEGGGAQRLLDNELVRQTAAWKQGQVVYLEPANTYLLGGGIHSMRRLLEQISDVYAKPRQPPAP
ncbi:siderophore ABC transporter substrate-binding protein [Corallococcus aberystwythensis]|uniref:Siderophore ABC transporter substrate-binding protein n=1 Tax=Corallococcus aberystwythensis TaxID=2316722 RepID=A0A3A8PM65_9BACT|nr:siderophore ABC transporter substrate-binding protein [Corallococcus aberystwythensis]RKH57477.1 siderophore ABC transporter substrate-binding protein [Corallococcus aberystwythensis]